MVSAMAASTARVSPSCQETTIENTTPTMIAMMARRCQARILGSEDRCATLPTRRPMPSPGGSASAPTGVITTCRALGPASPPDPAPSPPENPVPSPTSEESPTPEAPEAPEGPGAPEASDDSPTGSQSQNDGASASGASSGSGVTSPPGQAHGAGSSAGVEAAGEAAPPPWPPASVVNCHQRPR